MKKTYITFYATIIAGLVVASLIVVPFLRGKIFLLPIAIFFILSILLIYFAIKEKIKEKKFLILTGICAAGFFVFTVLHNLFYALAELSSNIFLLPSIFEFLHVAFFLIGVIGCPVGFLIGIIGSFIKKK